MGAGGWHYPLIGIFVIFMCKIANNVNNVLAPTFLPEEPRLAPVFFKVSGLAPGLPFQVSFLPFGFTLPGGTAMTVFPNGCLLSGNCLLIANFVPFSSRAVFLTIFRGLKIANKHQVAVKD